MIVHAVEARVLQQSGRSNHKLSLSFLFIAKQNRWASAQDYLFLQVLFARRLCSHGRARAISFSLAIITDALMHHRTQEYSHFRVATVFFSRYMFALQGKCFMLGKMLKLHCI